ncbi:hypothetical protein EGH24_04205 [Halonotius terrestris]|uniref:Uncharacterized protein n=1 Tax=Halonotius terrestris TaxID=2487750 RepID=A0A8J8PCV3_9EURY|nr:hypothetical protein [Halonotius terrestris]TQQ82658.1 hypothetical protein EGH24_04205 [Halonotius terrestris]
MTTQDRLLFPGVDIDGLPSGAATADDPPPAATGRLLTDGGQDTGRADGDAAGDEEVPSALDGVSDEQLESADVDLDQLKQLPKDELIGLLSEIIGDDEDESTTDDDSAEATQEAAATTDDGQPATPSDEPAAEVEWETSDEYQRPDGVELAAGTTMLVQCGSQDDRKHKARRDLLGLDETSDRNVLLIQYRSLDVERLEEIATNASRVKVITIGCSQSVPNAVSDTVEVVDINNPNDVTRLGILATKTLDDWSAFEGETAVSLDPLDVLFRYKTVEGTFRFLHIFLGKLSSGGAITHFFVNPSATDPKNINTLKPLFDYVMTIDDAGVDLEGA